MTEPWGDHAPNGGSGNRCPKPTDML